MCTLTVYSGKKRCVVTMNRDELRTRKEAGVLHSKSINDIRFFHPVDLVSGGTWFGVNNQGVILALLNRYQAPQTKEAKLDNSLTLLHRGHGPRVSCRDVRIEG